MQIKDNDFETAFEEFMTEHFGEAGIRPSDDGFLGEGFSGGWDACRRVIIKNLKLEGENI